MSRKKIVPHLVYADENGDIFDHPDLLMVARRGLELVTPRPDALIPLPEGSELFLLPGRHAVGLDPETGEAEVLEECAVAAFISPGHTLSATAGYETGDDAPVLPLFAYGAVGFANNRFYVAAKRVDYDLRQDFSRIRRERIQAGARKLLADYPKNRLVAHLGNCALVNCCPAARNLALGRFEAPLPTSRACNASCLGCLSFQPSDSPFPATQARLGFQPTPAEVAEVMTVHSSREKRPVLSFGQGCEGEPLTEAEVIAQAVRRYREAGGTGTVNVNTNASMPSAVGMLAEAGIDSIRASLVSAQPKLYEAYYRPRGYGFDDVVKSIATAKQAGLFVSLNFLFFPGVSDTEDELAALTALVETHKVDFIQMRNLNLDPELYLDAAGASGVALHGVMGLANFLSRLRKACPWLHFGYFNPYLEDGKPCLVEPPKPNPPREKKPEAS